MPTLVTRDTSSRMKLSSHDDVSSVMTASAEVQVIEQVAVLEAWDAKSTPCLLYTSATEQRKILDDVDDVVASFDETFDLPYVTTTYCARAAR